jgi:branched-chain amino acid transport system substrate-binding protein
MMRINRLFRFLTLLFLGLFVAGCSSEVKIGAIISETGAVKTYGARVKRGLNLALEEINAAGGFKGGQIQLIYKDDATNEQKGIKVIKELIEIDDVDLIIGAVSSNVTLAIAPIAIENKVVLLSPSASTPKLTGIGSYFYRLYPSDILEGTSMAEFAKELGLERVVIFALENTWSAGLMEVFTNKYESKYRKVVGTFLFTEEDGTDFAQMVADAQALNPDGIYVMSYDPQLPALFSQIAEHDMDCIMLGTSSITPAILREIGDAANMLVYPQPSFDLGSTDRAVANFIQAYEAKYNTKPDTYAAHGYDALYLMLAAMDNYQSKHPDNVRKGLGGIKNFEGAAGRTTFDDNGDVVRYPRLFIFYDGTAMPYKKFIEDGRSLFESRG